MTNKTPEDRVSEAVQRFIETPQKEDAMILVSREELIEFSTTLINDTLEAEAVKLEGEKEIVSKIGIGGLHTADIEMARNQALQHSADLIRASKIDV